VRQVLTAACFACRVAAGQAVIFPSPCDACQGSFPGATTLGTRSLEGLGLDAGELGQLDSHGIADDASPPSTLSWYARSSGFPENSRFVANGGSISTSRTPDVPSAMVACQNRWFSGTNALLRIALTDRNEAVAPHAISGID
jgi:hypothetical protein